MNPLVWALAMVALTVAGPRRAAVQGEFPAQSAPCSVDSLPYGLPAYEDAETNRLAHIGVCEKYIASGGYCSCVPPAATRQPVCLVAVSYGLITITTILQPVPPLVFVPL
jgi:hypothetical protein